MNFKRVTLLALCSVAFIVGMNASMDMLTKSQINFVVKQIPHHPKLTQVDRLKFAVHIYHRLKVEEAKKKMELAKLKKKEKELNLYREFLRKKAKTTPFLKDFTSIHF